MNKFLNFLKRIGTCIYKPISRMLAIILTILLFVWLFISAILYAIELLTRLVLWTPIWILSGYNVCCVYDDLGDCSFNRKSQSVTAKLDKVIEYTIEKLFKML